MHQSEHIVKDDFSSKDSESKMAHKVLSAFDKVKSDEKETKQRTVTHKNLSDSQYCKDCDIHYKRDGSCKVYLQTRVAKQPFKCNQCCLTFSQKAHLTNHSRRHKNEKPYQCNACSKAFTQSIRPKDDIKIHENNTCTFEI